METVKKTDEYEIVKKRSGRYGVRGANKKWLNGDDKVKVLLAEKLIKAAPPKEKAPEPAAEAAPAEPAADAAPAEAKAAPEAGDEQSAEEASAEPAPDKAESKES